MPTTPARSTNMSGLISPRRHTEEDTASESRNPCSKDSTVWLEPRATSPEAMSGTGLRETADHSEVLNELLSLTFTLLNI